MGQREEHGTGEHQMREIMLTQRTWIHQTIIRNLLVLLTLLRGEVNLANVAVEVEVYGLMA